MRSVRPYSHCAVSASATSGELALTAGANARCGAHARRAREITFGFRYIGPRLHHRSDEAATIYQQAAKLSR